MPRTHPRFHERVRVQALDECIPDRLCGCSRRMTKLLAVQAGRAGRWAEEEQGPRRTRVYSKGAHEAEANKGLFIPARTSLGDLQTHATCQRNRPRPTTSGLTTLGRVLATGHPGISHGGPKPTKNKCGNADLAGRARRAAHQRRSGPRADPKSVSELALPRKVTTSPHRRQGLGVLPLSPLVGDVASEQAGV